MFADRSFGVYKSPSPRTTHGYDKEETVNMTRAWDKEKL